MKRHYPYCTSESGLAKPPSELEKRRRHFLHN
uniref:Uncharacterized protein n=1 Tax=Arundo donax TaxID=35708 RepID=A0A0A9AXA0_ARUDO